MSKPIITVVGATGNQGRAVVRAFNASGRWQVRALTRNPSGPVAQQFAKEGVEVVQGDFTDLEDLVRAFSGSYAVYGLSIPPWQRFYNLPLSEFEQGKLQADAAKESGVRFFLWSTLPHIGDQFVLGGVPIHDDKAKVNDYIKQIGLPAIFIAISPFLQPLVDWPLIKFSEDGSTLETCNYVVKADREVALLYTEKDLGPSVLALANELLDFNRSLSDHPLNHQTQPVGSFRISWGELSKLVEKYTGIPTKHTVIESADERWDPDLTKCYVYQQEHGLYPDVPLPPKALLDRGVRFSTPDDYVQTFVVPKFGKDAQAAYLASK